MTLPSFLDEILENAKDPDTLFGLFLIEYKEDDSDRIHIFHEGKTDPAFYRPLIKRFSNSDRLDFICLKNKRSVLYKLNIFRKKFSNPVNNVIFIVDKDHDDYLGKSLPEDFNLYSTDYYSCENYICCQDSLLVYFSDHAKVNIYTIRTALIETYEENFENFRQSISLIMSWLICNRKIDDYNVKSLDKKLNGYICNRTFDLVYTIQETIDKLNENLKDDHLAEKIDTIEDFRIVLLNEPECHKWIRGKQANWFIVKFINNLIVDSKKVKKVQLSEDNSFQMFGGSIQTPAGLKSFLNRLQQV